ncbi:MAG TPA: ABC transporter ATP-binding protein [Terriglobales bacterium]|nr:ABC transporter ATP-binding protein [Terriglobales bacterium]
MTSALPSPAAHAHRLLRLLRYVRPYSLAVLASVLLLAATGLLEAFRVVLVKPILDGVLRPDMSGEALQPLFTIPHYGAVYLHSFVPSYFHNAWTMVAVALVGATAIKAVCDYCGTYLVNFAGFGMITDLRNELFDSILRRSVGFFSKHSTGTLLSTIVNDVERVQYAMSSVLGEFLQQVFTFIFTVAVAIIFGGKLAWVLLLFVPIVISSSRRIGRRVRQTTRKGQDKLAEIQHLLHETISGNKIVKAFNMEFWEAMRFRGASKRLFRANLRSVSAQAVSSPLMDLIGAVAVALLLWVGRERIRVHAMTLGAFFVFIVAVFKLYDPVRKFAQFYNNFQQALGASSAIFDFMEVEDDVKEKPHAIALPAFQHQIHFDHVDFSYDDEEGSCRVLSDINLEVKAGEVVAIVGPSGAGKSTLLRLLPRFFDVSAGAILIDGHDLRDVSIRSLRSQIGLVTQETVLFNDTVRNNIAYGRPNIPMDQVERASKAALAHDFILKLPAGYDTVIGERGMRLSGGERQRISIARALLKDSPILILDEATSALDAESESLVQSALQNLMANRTAFVIAHRLSTVRNADRIIVMENGAITDIGPHHELLQRFGTYQRLYNLQFVDVDSLSFRTREAGEEALSPAVPRKG